MKRIALLLLALAGLSLAACAPRAPDPDHFAEKFFEHGKDSILDAMKTEGQRIAACGRARHYRPPRTQCPARDGRSCACPAGVDAGVNLRE